MKFKEHDIDEKNEHIIKHTCLSRAHNTACKMIPWCLHISDSGL